jgi:S-adenosylmethionine decarboxylase
MPPLPPATHLCATLNGCYLEELCPSKEHLAFIGETLSARVRSAGFHIVGEAFHFFGPHAITGALVLAESHLCFHTWPEYGVVYLDLFTCAQSDTAVIAMRVLVEDLATDLFCANETNISVYDRNETAANRALRPLPSPSEGAR